MLSSIEKERIKVVLMALIYLKEKWCSNNPSEAEIMMNCSYLRTLLIHNELQKAWRSCGFQGQPNIDVDSDDGINIDEDGLEYAQNNPVTINGMTIYSLYVYNKIKENIRSKPSDGKSKKVKLSTYLETKCLIYEGKKRTRQYIINYACNKLGPTHFETTKREEDTERLRNEFKVGGDIDILFINMLSIAQTVLRAEDIKMFMEKAKELLQ